MVPCGCGRLRILAHGNISCGWKVNMGKRRNEEENGRGGYVTRRLRYTAIKLYDKTRKTFGKMETLVEQHLPIEQWSSTAINKVQHQYSSTVQHQSCVTKSRKRQSPKFQVRLRGSTLISYFGGIKVPSNIIQPQSSLASILFSKSGLILSAISAQLAVLVRTAPQISWKYIQNCFEKSQ